MAAPITLELMEGHQAIVADAVYERGEEIAATALESKGDKELKLPFYFFETVMSHMDNPELIPSDLQQDQIEDLMLGRATHEALRWRQIHQQATMPGDCVVRRDF